MSATKTKRSWSRRSRSSFSQNSGSQVWSSGPGSQTSAQRSQGQSLSSSLSPDAALLQSSRKLLSEFEELFVIQHAPLSDARVVNIRREIEKSMPRLYSLSNEQTSTHVSNQASLVKSHAEACLKKFPDVDPDVLRSYQPPETQSKPVVSPHSHMKPPMARISPPKGSILQGSHAPGSIPTMSLAAAAPAPPTQQPPQPISKMNMPPTSAQQYRPPHSAMVHATHAPSIMPMEHAMLRNIPLHLQDAVKRSTMQQQTVMYAVHELLSKSSFSRHALQLWFEPPASLSPEELRKITRFSVGDMGRMHAGSQAHQMGHNRPPHPLPTHTAMPYPTLVSDEHSRRDVGSHSRSASHDSSL